MIQEFKDFINKGNVFEAAVGLILALAFAPVVQGLVDNIIMPIVARIFGQPNFDSVRISLGGNYDIEDEAGNVIGTGPAYVEIGTWITTVIGFILLAFVVFMLVKAYNKSNAAAEEEEEEAGPTEIDLLTEIRDGLAR
jgi:large conductance mechanosensitive channel